MKRKPGPAQKTEIKKGFDYKNTAKPKDVKPGFLLFSIRNKIIICFAIPIIFMIITGCIAYQKAVKGMSQKFEESALQTLKMATEYVDMSCEFIEVEGINYAIDSDLGRFLLQKTAVRFCAAARQENMKVR